MITTRKPRGGGVFVRRDRGVLDLVGVALLVTVVAQVWRLFGLVVWP